MSGWPGDLSGVLRLSPGQRPAISSTRLALASSLAQGRPAAEVPALLATVFALCGQAHRWAASQALAAAQGAATGQQPEQALDHALATAREHAWRMAHDWPRLLPGAAKRVDAAIQLRACPLWREDWSTAERLAGLADWLAHHVLGRQAVPWLAAFDADPHAIREWVRRAPGPWAALLRLQRRRAQVLRAPGCSLAWADVAEADLQAWADAVLNDQELCRFPLWQGQVADTGPWRRAQGSADAPVLQPLQLTAWDRLVARLVELVRLSQPDAAQLLSCGTLALGPGRGMAWTEMSRGLLVHVAEVGGTAARPHVLRYRVVAPTEWNFHPQGVLGQALSKLPPTQCDAARVLAVAFDACVPVDVAEARSSPVSQPLEVSPCTN